MESTLHLVNKKDKLSTSRFYWLMNQFYTKHYKNEDMLKTTFSKLQSISDFMVSNLNFTSLNLIPLLLTTFPGKPLR